MITTTTTTTTTSITSSHNLPDVLLPPCQCALSLSLISSLISPGAHQEITHKMEESLLVYWLCVGGLSLWKDAASPPPAALLLLLDWLISSCIHT